MLVKTPMVRSTPFIMNVSPPHQVRCEEPEEIGCGHHGSPLLMSCGPFSSWMAICPILHTLCVDATRTFNLVWQPRAAAGDGPSELVRVGDVLCQLLDKAPVAPTDFTRGIGTIRKHGAGYFQV